MKQLRLAALAIATAAFLPYLASCTSDQNPFDVTFTTESNTAKIRLLFDVSSTRAEGDLLSTGEEKAISHVSLFVFDGTGKLEVSESDIAVSEDTPAEIEVKPGLKTVYVFASNKVVDLAVGESMADFEKKVFSSNLSDLKTSKGFVMVGKSEAQQVLVSANESEIPASNVFNIEMVRLVAKTQVKVVQNLDASSFGFTVGKPTFR